MAIQCKKFIVRFYKNNEVFSIKTIETINKRMVKLLIYDIAGQDWLKCDKYTIANK